MEEALAEIEVADSRFLGFVKRVQDEKEALLYQHSLKEQIPDAAHVPSCWVIPSTSQSGFDEDGEPLGSCGPSLLEQVTSRSHKHAGIILVVVRFFGTRLLGVTCGRLTQCYSSVSNLALQRFLHPGEPLVQEFLQIEESKYGLAAGDCEIVLNVVADPKNELLETVRNELEFEGFKGSLGEVLPRLQNLQSDISSGTIPVYRYPGNYIGDEWETFPWSPASLQVKESVEKILLPLVEQKMNHCVTNYYRDGSDFIEHHSDKDLDLNQDAVIVSVSLGDERVLELKRRAEPRDVTRVVLPHCSMLVLGPKTNKQFTHSILKKEGSNAPRISLTLRNVVTFMDLNTGRLFGQGVALKSLERIRRFDRIETGLVFVGFSTLSAFLVSRKIKPSRMDVKLGLPLAVTAAVATWSFRVFRKAWHKRHEEKEARKFFSKLSTSGTKY